MSLGERLKDVRLNLRMTQQDFADRISIKRSTLANYEQGRNEPIDSVISLICREYGVSEEWLREGTGEMYVPQAQTVVDELAEKYHLSPPVRLLVEKFILLPEDKQEAVIEFITEFAEDLRSGKLSELLPETAGSGGGGGNGISTGDPEIDQKLQAYREALEFEKKNPGKTSIQRHRIERELSSLEDLESSYGVTWFLKDEQ